VKAAAAEDLGQMAANTNGYRIEHDSMGEVRVPAHAKWRAQTQRVRGLDFLDDLVGSGGPELPQEPQDGLVTDAFFVYVKASSRRNPEGPPPR
jgi:hypothetical protein